MQAGGKSFSYLPGQADHGPATDKQMEIDTNVHRERIEYNCPYSEILTESEKSLYWSATKDAEDALACIAKVQERRKGDDGEIKFVLLSDEFRQLNKAIEQLDEATTLLHLIERAAAWTEGKKDRKAAALTEIAEKRGWENPDIDQREA